MNIAHPAAALLVILLCLAVAHCIAVTSPFFSRRLKEEEGGRFGGVDGLRGFLAVGVLFTHVINTWHFYTEGAWSGHGDNGLGSTGETGVALFFMITGFLFWRRVLRSPENGALDTVALYRSRIRRIVPMYVASVLIVLVVVAVMSGFSLNSSPGEVLRELRSWFSFGFMNTGEINGVADARYINPVYWTLAFEWGFYLALPFLALFARGPWSIALFALVVLFGLRVPVTLNFLCGALAALAVERGLLVGRRLESAYLTPVAIAALLGGLHFSYGPAHTLLLFVFFLLVVGGNTLFGLLATTSARLLGMVSYSYYLLHSIVLFVIMRQVELRISMANLGALEYWLFAGLAAAVAVLLSALTYRHIEYPFFAKHAITGEGSASWPRLVPAS